ncbi:MAG: DUF4245 domain-containing protein [Cryobacterium sp.]|uniref:DUF4245 domain-containing protein n=1 Tax=unclassified Cryobacterium TaxID=2649013 RepID=UPI0018C9BBC9|nr:MULTISPECIES: DUF4245 domain-containing protein [unclassified Cryobacterium]MCY7405198.1 DUF4245 domain-containing protein [Cryobacterium sp.]MEC5153055.1 hypothetical protein [Cryobacterium sp. CAN_C3]
MSRAPKQPRVVAELGRPETPQETAERLAENSRKYRSHKTVNNLVLSLLVTVGAVLVLVLLVPRSDNPINRDVDYASVAAQLQPVVDHALAIPELPDGWSANDTEWQAGTNGQVPSWYIGLLTPGNQYIGFSQAFNANPTWLAQKLPDSPVVDSVSIAGVTWDVYRNSAAAGDRGNFDYALVTAAGASTYVLIGTAPTGDFETLATALAENVAQNAAE